MLLVLCNAFFLCTTDHNPFRDYRNAQISIVAQTFDNLDTLEIFSRETLLIVLSVPNLVDSVIVRSPSNIEFDNGQLCIFSADSKYTPGQYPVYFSFFDTGMQTIEFLTYRTNGEVVKMNLQCYTKSPLNQQTINANLGDTIRLATQPLENKVLYEWNIGGSIFTSATCCTSVVLKDIKSSGKGVLRARYKTISSPVVEFDYKFIDLLAPEIALMPITYTVCGDTVKTSEKTFYFTVSIKDRGGERIDSAAINGMRFDKIQNNLYTKIFYDFDKNEKPVPVSLYASDNYIYRNVATARYYLQYDSKINNYAGVQISVISPSDDTCRVSTDMKEIFVKLNRYTEQHKDIEVIIESNIKDAAVEHDSTWIGKAFLSLGTNPIKIKAVSGKNVLDSVEKVIVYDSTSLDIVKPVILEVRAGGEIIRKNEYTLSESIVEFEIIAFDEASGIDTFLINKNVLPVSPDKFLWKFTDTLQHQPQGDTFLIKVVDKKGNTSQRELVVYFNNKPTVLKNPNPPKLLVIGNTYIDTIKVHDDDGDPLSLSIFNSSKMTISSEGIIHYKPDSSEKGIRNFSIEADDGYGKNLIYTFDILVMEKNEVPKPVRFITTDDQLRKRLRRDEKALFNLIIDTLTGMPPYQINSFILSDHKVPVEIENNTITVGPFLDEIVKGEFHCMITVHDSLLTADTLYLVLDLLQEETLALELSGTYSYYQEGVIDLRDSTGLIFKIIDPDRSDSPNYSVSVKRKDKVIFELKNFNADNFSITLNDSGSLFGYDTLLVSVNTARCSSSYELVVYYGNNFEMAVLYKPEDLDTIVDTNIVFFWKASKNSDLLWELRYGLNPVIDKKVFVDTNICTLQIKKSGLYKWMIYAFSGEILIESETRLVQVQNPLHVKFDLDQIKFNTEYEVNRDSIIINLPVKNRNMPDSAYRCYFDENRQTNLPVIGGKLKYLPLDKDSGWHWLIATVTDEAGNSDTFKQVINITKRPHLQCELLPRLGRKKTADGAFDLSHVNTPDTFEFYTGRVPDSVRIKLQHSESVVKNAKSNRIMVIIDPDKILSSRDTMTIFIREGNDIQKYNYTFYYGTAPVVSSPTYPDSGSFKKEKLDTLKWSFTDIDNDTLRYDLYFGSNPDPELIASNLLESRFVFNPPVNPGIYYWKVIANDGRFRTESPVWMVYVNTYVVKINTLGVGLTRNLTNVPVLVRLDSPELPASVQSIVFRKGKSPSDTLPFEIDYWKIDDGKGAAVWVLMDTVRADDSTQFLTMQLGGDTELASNGNVVFDTANGYACVLHLQDSLNLTSGLFLDATFNKINGDDRSNGDREGIIGYGKGFERRVAPISDHIKFVNYPKLGTYNEYMSCETWVKPDDFHDEGIIFLLNGAGGYKFKMSMESGYLRVATRPNLPVTIELRSSGTISDENWHHVVCAVNFSSGEFSIFIDGEKDTSETKVIGNIPNWTIPEAILGSELNGMDYFLGHVDEFRINHKERSPDWIKFCYENQRPNSTVIKVIP